MERLKSKLMMGSGKKKNESAGKQQNGNGGVAAGKNGNGRTGKRHEAEDDEDDEEDDEEDEEEEEDDGEEDDNEAESDTHERQNGRHQNGHDSEAEGDEEDDDDDDDDEEEEKRQRAQSKRKNSRSSAAGRSSESRGSAKNGEKIRRLSPVQIHYLKKALVDMQIGLEFGRLDQPDALLAYGDPFTTAAKKQAVASDEVPITGFLFQQFLIRFPIFDKVPKNFWKEIVTFFESMAEKNLSSTRERGEITKRRLFGLGLTFYIGTVFLCGLKCKGEENYEKDYTKGPAGWGAGGESYHLPNAANDWLDGVHGIRDNAAVRVTVVTDDEATDSFIIHTKSRKRSTFVRRSAKNFLTFTKQFRKETGLFLPPAVSPGSSNAEESARLTQYLQAICDQFKPSRCRALEKFLHAGSLKSHDGAIRSAKSSLARQETELSRRDAVWSQACQNANAIFGEWKNFKDELIWDPEGHQRAWDTTGSTKLITSLSEHYRRAIEYAAVYVAEFIYGIFVANASGPELFNIFRIFHVLTPYFPISVALRVANPSFMLSMLYVVLFGRPLFGSCIFQIFANFVVKSDLKTIKKQEIVLKKEVGNSALCDAIAAFPEMDRDEQDEIRRESVKRNEDIVLTILRNSSAKAEVANLEDDPERLDGLKLWLKNQARKRDRLQVGKLVSENNTPAMLRDIFLLFNPVLSGMHKAANLANRFLDLQSFFADIVGCVQVNASDPNAFVLVAAKHQQALYTLVHECQAKGKGLTEPLIDWLDTGLGWMRNATQPRSGEKLRRGVIDLDKLLRAPEVRKHRAKILKEINGLVRFNAQIKLLRAIRVRNRKTKVTAARFGNGDLLLMSYRELGLPGKGHIAMGGAGGFDGSSYLTEWFACLDEGDLDQFTQDGGVVGDEQDQAATMKEMQKSLKDRDLESDAKAKKEDQAFDAGALREPVPGLTPPSLKYTRLLLPRFAKEMVNYLDWQAP